jgi:hypothetical protein
MRLHPAIIGLSTGVPSVVCNSSAKAASMLPRVGLGEVLAPGLEDPTGLFDALEKLRRPDVPRGPALWRRLEPARCAAGRGLEVVHRLLDRPDGHRHR